MTKEFSQEFYLSAGEVNAEGEMSLSLLVSKIIDIATAHANSLGIGNPAMESLGRGWVLSRIAIEVSRYPKVNENYKLTTWIESWNRHFSSRNFMLSDACGNPVGYGRSIWMILDTNTRESVGLSHLNFDPELISDRECPIQGAGKHCIVLPQDFDGEIPRGGHVATHEPYEYMFKYGDLDFYRHVNTVRYVTMILNQFGLAEMDSTIVSRLEMSFMREGRYGEVINLLRSDDDLHSAFSIQDAEESTPLLFAQTLRKPRV
ncbi:MAG: hypothetical protein K2M87_02900 [Muribaculaceae bacterium]|nr:hypothetical protein [Muribaculaceae bacterium]